MSKAPFARRSTLSLPSLVLFLSLVPFAAAPQSEVILRNATFQEAFTSYYQSLGGFSSIDLRTELSETIEDILATGSHMTQTSLDYKIRQIESAIDKRLAARLCSKPMPQESFVQLKQIAVSSIQGAAADAAVAFDAEAVGMLSGVLVRLIQAGYTAHLCGR